MNGSEVSGNATLFSGTTVETVKASSRLNLGKARVELNPGSRIKVSDTIATLEQGAGEIAGSGYSMEARTLRIQPLGGEAVAKVRLQGSETVLVAAASGPVRVYNHLGDVVANVLAGSMLSLTPVLSQVMSSTLNGELRKVEGRYLLTDTTANVTVELRGTNLEENVGKIVEVNGATLRTATPAPGASHVVRVIDIKAIGTPTRPEQAQEPPPAAPSKPGATARPPQPEGRGGGMSSGTRIALVVAAAGGAAGAAIAAAGGGSKSR